MCLSLCCCGQCKYEQENEEEGCEGREEVGEWWKEWIVHGLRFGLLDGRWEEKEDR